LSLWSTESPQPAVQRDVMKSSRCAGPNQNGSTKKELRPQMRSLAANHRNPSRKIGQSPQHRSKHHPGTLKGPVATPAPCSAGLSAKIRSETQPYKRRSMVTAVKPDSHAQAHPVRTPRSKPRVRGSTSSLGENWGQTCRPVTSPRQKGVALTSALNIQTLIMPPPQADSQLRPPQAGPRCTPEPVSSREQEVR